MRKIYLIGSIDAEMYEQFSRQLDELVSKSKQPIELEVCSEGGEDNIAFAIYDKMRSCKAKFHVTAYGEVQSAAILIVAAGDIRKAGAQTVFMVHESSAELDGETKDLRREVARLERSEEQFYRLIEKHSSTSYEVWRTMAKQTSYFTSETALSHGLIDKVVG